MQFLKRTIENVVLQELIINSNIIKLVKTRIC